MEAACAKSSVKLFLTSRASIIVLSIHIHFSRPHSDTGCLRHLQNLGSISVYVYCFALYVYGSTSLCLTHIKWR